MPKPKSSKSRVAKSTSKKSAFRFRWWMGLALVVLIAIIGVVVVRFSQAGGGRNFYVDNGTIQSGGGADLGPADNGRRLGYTASNNRIGVHDGTYAQVEERFADIVSGHNPANVEKADIEVCFTAYTWDYDSPYSFTIEILDWGGKKVAIAP